MTKKEITTIKVKIYMQQHRIVNFDPFTANYIAMDKNGQVFLYEKEPLLPNKYIYSQSDAWTNSCGSYCVLLAYNSNINIFPKNINWRKAVAEVILMDVPASQPQ